MLKSYFAVVRYNANGSIDSSFGTNGYSKTTLTKNNHYPTCMALQQDGKIIVGGWVTSSGGYDIGMVRYKSNGQPDSTFGTTGIVLTTNNSYDFTINAIKVLSNGKIMLGGGSTYTTSNNNNFTLVQYQKNGKLDSSFGRNGFTNTKFTLGSVIKDLAILPDGKIIAVGGDADINYQHTYLARYNSNGSADNSFSTNGKAAFDWGDAESVVVQRDGKYLVGGDGFVACRFTENGKIDSTFGMNGSTKPLVFFPYCTDYSTSILVSNNKILVTGYSIDYELGSS